jgi:14-3-3 protein epsilon
MKVRMADLWKPVKGVTIKETKAGKFLFHFAHPLDMEAVLNGGPWSFDNNTLILEQVPLGMQIEQIPLTHVNMWVQVHDLPTGLMKERVGIPLANYIGTFVEYDKNNNTSFWRQYMRIRVRLDVRRPLTKDTKVKDKEGNWCTVKFKYEKLGIFCFVCGVMGHAENKCEVRYSMEEDDGVREWSADIRADNRRQGGRLASRWLREEGGGPSEPKGGAGRRQPPMHAEGTNTGPTPVDLAANSSSTNHNRPTHNNLAIITQQNNALAINAQPTHTLPHIPNLEIGNNYPIITTPINSMPAITSEHATVPSFTPISNTSNPFPISNIYSSINNHQFTPLNLSRPQTDNNNYQSLTSQILSFSSQPMTRTPQHIKATNHKLPRITTRKGVSARPTSPANPDPNFHHSGAEKNTKIPTQLTNPTLTRPDPILTQVISDDMDAQTEKKRRREEESVDDKKMKESEHFLTAGPGSQACRDQ